ncbi:MAG TPA: universal stress protein [Candidatus Binatia bacterium]|nr:universal stress protein [Candidatus Binatia bacterium]
MPPIRRILHPTDFSRASGAAFARAIDMAKSNGAELIVLHVIVPVLAIPAEGYVSPDLYQDLDASNRSAAQKQIDTQVARAKKAGVKKVSSLILEGTTAERIAQAAKSRRADLIVIGTHGRTGLARFFLGSVASRVVSMASCPVLTVRGK